MRSVRINLLGPIEVLRDGVLATPSALKLRQVLSLLALNANDMVHTGQLIEELWEGNPPPSVTTTLQTYVYQLRKRLWLDASHRAGAAHREARCPALHTLPSGYLLALDSDALDIGQFERLATRGRNELEAGSAEAALTTLNQAIGLWRGPALVDVNPGMVLHAKVVHLEEMRVRALEHRVDATLVLGRHHAALDELTLLSAQMPTHEGFQAKLMLALYRSGRRSEALKVYDRTRRTLATELGLDPSQELQRLHHGVLTADGSLDWRETEAVEVRRQATAEPPRQLPPEAEPLVGREDELRAITTAMGATRRFGGPAVVAIEGLPGSGKSALCVRAGHLLREQYPDGQFHARLLTPGGEPIDPGEVLGGFLHATGMVAEQIPDSAEDRAKLFRTWTAERRVLVVLDDVPGDTVLEQLIPSSRDCAVLAVSRRRLVSGAVTATVRPRPLTTAESVQLLTNAMGGDRTDVDPCDLRRLVNLHDGLPAALQSTATRMKRRPRWSVARMLEWLETGSDAPAEIRDDPLGLRAGVLRSDGLGSAAARSAFRRLSTLDGPEVGTWTAAAELTVSHEDAEAVLDELVDLSLLVTATGETEFRFPRAVRRIGRQLHAEDQLPQQGVLPRLAAPRLLTEVDASAW
ncbi:BTAD domain-containing putative transcriptional regulator [Amycolatopsis sp. NPDC058986]|uniref:AfsR/SARP family transcriptional regulator n=1 Tax=unclassified Amycolatopsis TaxID=2618356 RepID=UPI00366A7590